MRLLLYSIYELYNILHLSRRREIIEGAKEREKTTRSNILLSFDHYYYYHLTNRHERHQTLDTRY